MTASGTTKKCRFGAKCKKSNCKFVHPLTDTNKPAAVDTNKAAAGNVPPPNEIPTVEQVEASLSEGVDSPAKSTTSLSKKDRRATIKCRYGTKCRAKHCKYLHPERQEVAEEQHHHENVASAANTATAAKNKTNIPTVTQVEAVPPPFSHVSEDVALGVLEDSPPQNVEQLLSEEKSRHAKQLQYLETLLKDEEVRHEKEMKRLQDFQNRENEKERKRLEKQRQEELRLQQEQERIRQQQEAQRREEQERLRQLQEAQRREQERIRQQQEAQRIQQEQERIRQQQEAQLREQERLRQQQEAQRFQQEQERIRIQQEAAAAAAQLRQQEMEQERIRQQLTFAQQQEQQRELERQEEIREMQRQQAEFDRRKEQKERQRIEKLQKLQSPADEAELHRRQEEWLRKEEEERLRQEEAVRKKEEETKRQQDEEKRRLKRQEKQRRKKEEQLRKQQEEEKKKEEKRRSEKEQKEKEEEAKKFKEAEERARREEEALEEEERLKKQRRQEEIRRQMEAAAKKKSEKKDKKAKRYEKYREEAVQQEQERAQYWVNQEGMEEKYTKLIKLLCAAEFLRQNKHSTVIRNLTPAKVVAGTGEDFDAACHDAFRKLFSDDVHSRVVVAGFNQDLDGRVGTIEYWDADKAKFSVILDTKKGTQEKESVFFKPGHLKPHPQSAQKKKKSKKAELVHYVDLSSFYHGLSLSYCFVSKKQILEMSKLKSADAYLTKLMEQRDEEDRLKKEQEEQWKQEEERARKRRAEQRRREQEEYEEREREYQKSKHEYEAWRKEQKKEEKRREKAYQQAAQGNHSRYCECPRCLFEDFFLGGGFFAGGPGGSGFFFRFSVDDDSDGYDSDEWDRQWSRQQEEERLAKNEEYADMLGVSTDAAPEAIKREYRRQALKYHPDKYRAENHEDGMTKSEAEEHFKNITNAYDHLMSNFDDGDY